MVRFEDANEIEASDLKVCEEYLESDVLGFFYDNYLKDDIKP